MGSGSGSGSGIDWDFCCFYLFFLHPANPLAATLKPSIENYSLNWRLSSQESPADGVDEIESNPTFFSF